MINLRDDESGSALIELALMVGLLGVPLLLGAGEVAPLMYDSAEIENAAHAGALYGMQSQVFAADSAGIISSAQTEAADFGTNLVVTPLTYYTCATSINSTQYTGTNALANATAGCTGINNHPLQFIQVTTTLQVIPSIRCPGLPATYTLTGFSMMEVEK